MIESALEVDFWKIGFPKSPLMGATMFNCKS
jgi:hypothetical protein